MSGDRIEGSFSSALGFWLPTLAQAWRESRGIRPTRGGERRAAGASLSRAEIDSVAAALLKLQRGLTGKRNLAGAPYMENPDSLGAYLLYYWPVSYLEASLAISELGLRPRRVLDLGSGPGPASAAARDAGAAEVFLMDGSERALSLAARLLDGAGLRIGTRVVDLEAPDAPGPAAGPFDLVILGHCLNELGRGRADRGARAARLLGRAAGLLAPGGALLVIEPALLETSREALALRDALAERGHRILGPCPTRASGPYRCPALASGPERTCHAEAAWDPPEPVAALAAKAGLDRRSVKFSWFAAGPVSASPTEVPLPGRADGKTTLEGRIVSDPLLNKAGRIRYVLCSEGALVNLSAPRAAPEARDCGFLSLRRGDRLRASGIEPRPGGGFGLAPGSSIELLGRMPEIGR